MLLKQDLLLTLGSILCSNLISFTSILDLNTNSLHACSMASIEIFGSLRVIFGVGGVVLRMLDASEVWCSNDEFHVVCIKDVGSVGMVACLLLRFGNDLHAYTLLDQFHGRQCIAACVFQVMKLDDFEFISVGVIKAISVGRLAHGWLFAGVVDERKEIKQETTRKARVFAFISLYISVDLSICRI